MGSANTAALVPKLERLRIEWLYHQSVSAQTAGLINSGIYLFVAKNLVAPSLLTLWGILVGVIFMGRMIFHRWFNSRFVKAGRLFEPKLWENLFVLGTFLSSACWGIA